MMKVDQFIARLKEAASYPTLYVMGCFGAPMTKQNKELYCINHKYNKDPKRTAMIQAADEQTFGFDCVNLIKGILWGWCADRHKVYGGAMYGAHGVPDYSANQFFSKCCKDQTTDFTKIQPGWAVWMDGHIGVYIGDGNVIECSPKWSNNVQYTKLGNIKSVHVDGEHSRIWTKCGPIIYVDYSRPVQASEPVSPWAADAWNWAKDKGYCDGLRPKDTATREEVVTILFRILGKE